MSRLALVVLFIGWGLAAFGLVTGIGVAIYNYAHEVALGVSLWLGFTTWLKMLVIGMVLIIIGWWRL